MIDLQIRAATASPALRAAAELRGIPERVIPYAASTAATRVARHLARVEIPAEMQRVFDRPTRWTLNSLAVTPATKNNMSARVFVKNQGARVPQERFLVPGTEGGPRGEKAIERKMCYEGILPTGARIVPGDDAELDAHGNITAASFRRMLTALGAGSAASSARATKAGQKQRRGRALKNALFAGSPKGGSRPAGIWRREGQRLKALAIFVQNPTYRPRLDFEGLAARLTRERFEPEFLAAAQSILSRNSR